MTSLPVHVEGMPEQTSGVVNHYTSPVTNVTPAPEQAAQIDGEPTDPVTPTDGTTDPATDGTDPATPEPDSFPRTYVEQLRKESAGYRDRAKLADEAMTRLAAATVQQAAGTMLADPTDLPYDPATMADGNGFPDPGKITEAARQLIDRKPHLASRKPSGDAGQGPRTSPQQVDLASILRAKAG